MALIREGESAVDESMLTGESMPVEKRAGRRGFRRHDQPLRRIPVSKRREVGRGTVLQQMIELVKQAQGSRAPGRAAGRCRQRLFHGGRAGRGGAHVRGMAVLRAVRHRHGERGGGADHRVPVRAGAGHAGRDHGRAPAAAPSAAS